MNDHPLRYHELLVLLQAEYSIPGAEPVHISMWTNKSQQCVQVLLPQTCVFFFHFKTHFKKTKFSHNSAFLRGLECVLDDLSNGRYCILAN